MYVAAVVGFSFILFVFNHLNTFASLYLLYISHPVPTGPLDPVIHPNPGTR